ncbi:MAG: response regulator [Planctomycetes bacterium]|nr:response regulator [Planctomycetota bacterium]
MSAKEENPSRQPTQVTGLATVWVREGIQGVQERLNYFFLALLGLQWLVLIGTRFLSGVETRGSEPPLAAWAVAVCGSLAGAYLVFAQVKPPIPRHVVVWAHAFLFQILIHAYSNTPEIHVGFLFLLVVALYQDPWLVCSMTLALVVAHLSMSWGARNHYLPLGLLVLEAGILIAAIRLFHGEALLLVEPRVKAEERCALGAQELALRTQEHLRSEERFNRLLDHGPIGMATVSPDGRFTRVNPALCRMLGYEAQELQRLTFQEITHPEDLAEDLDLVNQLLKGEITQYRLEKRYFRKDGQMVWGSLYVALMRDETGRPLYFISQVVDITERRRELEELRETKLAAERANRAKGDFLAVMSHEIRTPMNGILGLTELLLDGTSDPAQREHLLMIKGSADALLTLINDILDLSKIDAGKVVLERLPFSPSRVAVESVRALAKPARDKGLNLVCDVASDVPACVLGDGARLRQVLLNLLANAVKFTSKGQVVLEISVQPEPSHGEVELRFAVRDTGPGIPEGRRAAIFEAFEQAEPATARTHGGTGLGLAICRRLVTAMGGVLGLESKVGVGSTFAFKARFQAAAEEVDESGVFAPLAGKPVLIVDPQAAHLKSLRGLLERWGLRPMCAADGERAQRLLEAATAAFTPVPLVLLDPHLPRGNGYALAEWIRKQPLHKDAVIVALTSGYHAEDAIRAQRAGCDGSLQKPLHAPDLRALLRRKLQPVESQPVGTSSHAWPERREILLAEDNLVSQAVVSRILEKAGFAVTVAGDGAQAVDWAARKSFDAILMDVQMPVLDGLSATRRIRAEEARRGGHTPIVALTAHALADHRALCNEAGMDAFLEKPIRSQNLYETLSQFLGRRVSASGVKLPAAVATDSAAAEAPGSHGAPVHDTVDPKDVFDRERAIEQAAGDEALLSELFQLFMQEWPARLKAARAALESGDAQALSGTAHAVKGAVSNFHALRAREAAQHLEKLGKAGDLKDAGEALERLVLEVDRFAEAARQAVPAV